MISEKRLNLVAPLFVPADRPERFEKAAGSAADTVILDLEDGVAPENKARARSALRTGFGGQPVLLRINPADTPWHGDDVAAFLRLDFDGLVIPKATVESFMQVKSRVEGAKPDVPLLPLIETARGMADARELASMPTVDRLIFGSLDYGVDINAQPSREALLTARSELVLASRLGSLQGPVDGVTADIRDLDAATDDAEYAKGLGFAGKLCIHPAQAGHVLRAFAPSEAEVEWARRVLACSDGAVSLDGVMVDAPVKARARALLRNS